MYDVTLRLVRATVAAVEKQLSITQAVCIFVANKQWAYAVLSTVACPAQHFPALPHKRHDFRKTVIEHNMCVSIFYTIFVCNIFHSKKNWARYDTKCILVLM
jgi:hypothetical protein